jgi:hypothetical protein
LVADGDARQPKRRRARVSGLSGNAHRPKLNQKPRFFESRKSRNKNLVFFAPAPESDSKHNLNI